MRGAIYYNGSWCFPLFNNEQDYIFACEQYILYDLK